ncbi:MAG: hypothetical protein E7390_05335 [Ruminococcaceae bacterium]|nr:hypothetical protein [Oscillospiraceae bacterium]
MYQCGFYESDITPPLGCSIPGYFRKRLGEDVRDRLHAKAAVISDGKTEVAILSVDNVGFYSKIRAGIQKRVEEYTGISSSNLILCATHAHTGGSGEDRQTNGEIDALYLEMLTLLAADAVTLAKKRMQPCALRYATGNVEGHSFVRNYRMRDGSVRTNPGWDTTDIVEAIAKPNTELPVLFAEDEEGKLIGAITNFALHNDCVAGNAYSSDYAGKLGEVLKKTYGQEFVTVFTTGFCGNINHMDYIGKTSRNYVDIGEALAAEVVRLAENTEAVSGAVSAVTRRLSVKTRNVARSELDELREFVKAYDAPTDGSVDLAYPEKIETKYRYAVNILQKYENLPPEKEVELTVLCVGDVCFYSMPGEPFSEFRELIKEGSPFKKYFAIEMNGSHHGYIPTKGLEETAVYEAGPISNSLSPEAGYRMVDALLAMATEIVSL